jgi:uncharacterized membrane protein YccC
MRTPIRFVGEHRARLLDGLRLTLAFIAPLGVGGLFADFELGLLVGFGGIQVALADLGGSYRKKAVSMSATAVTVMVAAFCGSAAAVSGPLAVAVAFAGALLCGMASLYGHTAANNSTPVLATLMVTMGFPAGFEDAALRALALGAGGLWSMLLSLWLWPLRPSGPSRDSTGGCYRALAALIREETAPAFRAVDSAMDTPPVLPVRATVMEAIRNARDTLTENRGTRQGFSSTGQDLLFLNGNAEQIYSALIAVGSLAGLTRRHALSEAIEAGARALLEEIAEVLEDLEPAISAGGGDVPTEEIRRRMTGLTSHLQEFRERAPSVAGDLQSLFDIRNLLHGLQAVVRLVDLAAETTRSLGKGVDQRHALPMLAEEQQPTAGFIETLRDNLNLQSLTLRYALRLAVAIAAAVAVARFYHIERGYWVSMTVALILKPDFSGTRSHSLGRVLGTVTGGLVGAGFDVVVKDRLLNYLLLFPIGVVTFAQRNSSYPRFVAFLTTFIVLMLNLITPGDLRLPLLRAVDTAMGSLIALLAGYALWPHWEGQSFPARLAAAIRANHRFLALVLARYRNGRVSETELARARADALLELSNAGVSFQRLLTEPASRRGDPEPYYALVVGTRQIFDAATALLSHLPPSETRYELPGLDEFAAAAGHTMHELEEAVRDRRVTEDLPDLEDALEELSGHMEDLTGRRLKELAAQREFTPTRQFLRDYTAAARLVHLIADELSAMDRALFRLCGNQR